MQKKYSISFIIVLIFLMVFVFFVAPLTMYSYKNFQNALNKNIENYLAQVSNITQTLFEQEAFVLDSKAVELSSLISNTSLSIVENMNLDNDIFSDDIDLLFVKTNNNITNLSTSLFDTDAIIQQLSLHQASSGCIKNIMVDNENISILFKSKKIIQKNSGKVIGEVFVGKLLNENLTFLNKIVQKADIKALSFLLNEEVLATSFDTHSQENRIVQNIDMLMNNKTTYEHNNNVFSKLPLICENIDTAVKLIPVIDSGIFKVLKDDYNQQIFILLSFFIIVGIITFFLIRKFIIYPMYQLLEYAKDIKTIKKEYPNTIIQEYSVLASGLQNVISELRDVKEQYTLAVEGTQEGLWDWNISENKIYFSKRGKEILGFKEKEQLDLITWTKRIHNDDKQHMDQHLIEHLKQKVDVFEDELRVETKSGQYKWIKIKAKALFDEKAYAYRMLGFISDIDQLKELEAQNKEKESFILEQSKISAMGDMLSNIAHQWRQPLSLITSVVSGIKVQLELDMMNKEDISKDLDIINKTSQNMSKTIDSFKDSYELEHIKEAFNLNEALLRNIQILEPAFTYNNISFVTKTYNVDYYGYKDEFLLVLNKIIQNAKDAFQNQKMKTGYIFINLSEVDGEIVLTVYDNAKGIDENIKDKIFEPYFTTKHKAQGVGLSLYVAKNIVTKYFNGTITFTNKTYEYENSTYTGACFTITFPKQTL